MNTLELIHSDYIRSCRTVETVLVSNNQVKKIFYVYNYEGNSFRLFDSCSKVNDFFQNDNDNCIKHFITEKKLDDFLCRVNLENLGESCGFYNLFNLISNKKLHEYDYDNNEMEMVFSRIIKTLQDESQGTFEFAHDNDLVILKKGIEKYRIQVNEFLNQAFFFLSRWKVNSSATFSILEIESFLNSYQSITLKVKSDNKRDVRIEIHDSSLNNYE